MTPEVEAAIIAAGVGILTLIGAAYGTRKSSQDTKDALNEQITEQSKQLDKTLKVQSDQLDRTLDEQRTGTLNERFATAADQLGSDKPAVRLAGVYAMAVLADDWEANRQTCVDAPCAYLRMPYEPDPGDEAPGAGAACLPGQPRSPPHCHPGYQRAPEWPRRQVWRGLKFDFTGVVFDGGDFGGVNFFRRNFIGTVSFVGAEFPTGRVNFRRAEFPEPQRSWL